MSANDLSVPAGIIAVTTYGQIQGDTASCLLEMRGHAEKIGLSNISWQFHPSHLVDKARNDAAQALLASKASWLWFIDGDMTFEPNLIEYILKTAYGDYPNAEIIGGYCNLRGSPYLPTIDRGSGQWESHDAQVGPLEVIRTGTACLLIKRSVFEKMKFPWFGVRSAPEPIECFAEVDGFFRRKYDGRNPCEALPEWQKAVEIAAADAAKVALQHPAQKRSTVGEDSNFCDAAKALGMTIIVQTNAVCRHMDSRTIGPEDHMKVIQEARDRDRALVGIG